MEQQSQCCGCRIEDVARVIAEGIRAAVGPQGSASQTNVEPRADRCCQQTDSARVVVVMCGCGTS